MKYEVGEYYMYKDKYEALLFIITKINNNTLYAYEIVKNIRGHDKRNSTFFTGSDRYVNSTKATPEDMMEFL